MNAVEFGRVRQLILAGNYSEALKMNERLRMTAPQEPMYWVQAARIHGFLDDYRSGRDAAMRSAQCVSKDLESAFFVVQQLRAHGLRDEIIAIYREYGERLPFNALDDGVFILSSLDEPDLAIAVSDDALRRKPEHAALWFNRGLALMFKGDIPAATEAVETGLGYAPCSSQGLNLLTLLRRPTENANAVRQIQQAIERSRDVLRTKGELQYSLHRELDGLGMHGEAAAALAQGSRDIRRTINYDVATDLALMELLKSLPPTADDTSNATSGPAPIFIVGLHRSGTTLLEQILSSHSDVHPLGETAEFTRAMMVATNHYCHAVVDPETVRRSQRIDMKDVGTNYLEVQRKRVPAGTRWFTDKLPSNFLNIGFICEALPNAQIFHLVREPEEVAFSNFREIYSGQTNLYSYDLNEFASFYQGYRSLMAHWHRCYPQRIIDVSYSQLTSDPETTVSHACQVLGIDFHDDMLEIESQDRVVTTASATQVRQSIKRNASGKDAKWRRYEALLAPIRQMRDAE